MGRRPSDNLKIMSDYQKVGTVNFSSLAENVKILKGNRSQLEFAKDCGCSQGTISNLLNGKQKNIEAGLIERLWFSKPEKCTLTLEEFTKSCGYSKIVPEINDSAMVEKTEKNFVKLIQDTLLDRGYSVKLKKDLEYNDSFNKFTLDAIIETDALKEHGRHWMIKVIDGEDVYSSIVEMLKIFFLKLYIREDKEHKTKLSVAISDYESFYKISRQYGNIIITDYVSIILIDEKKRVIIDEFIFKQSGESKKVKSVFM